MTEIKIELDKEAIEKKVVDSILESSLGDRINVAIDKVFKNEFGKDDPIQKAVEGVVVQNVNFVAREIVENEYREVIATKVREKITTALIEKMLDAIIHVMIYGKE